MIQKIVSILIIEDDIGLNELMEERLQENEYLIFCFQTGAAALDWLKTNSPTLMIVDYSLLDMNAQEFITSIKTQTNSIPPFIVATGQGDERIAVEMMKLGAKEYIIKDCQFLNMLPLVTKKVISEIEKDSKLVLSEQRIIELSQFNKQIIESAHEGIIVYDKDLNYLTWNPFMEKLTGFSAENVIGKNAIELFPFLNEADEANDVSKLIKEIRIIEKEFEFNIPSTGKFGWVNETSVPFYNSDGEVVGVIATIHDITERKKAEKALELTKQSYVDIINTVSEAIYVLDENFTFININNGAKKMYQLSDEELIGKTPADVAAPGLNNLKQVQELLQNTFKTGVAATFEFWAVRKNGEIFPKEVIVNKGRYFEKDVLVATARDITERKNAVEALLSSEEKYRSITENITDVVWVSDLDFNLSYISPSASKMYGVSKSELVLFYKLDNRFPPHSVEKIKKTVAEEIEKDKDSTCDKNRIIVGEVGHYRSDGSEFTAEIRLSFLRDKNDKIIGIQGTTRDISERIAAENELKRSEEKYRQITDNISDVVWTSDLQFNLNFISPSVEKMIGETAEKHLQRSVREKFSPQSLAKIVAEFNLELEKEKDPNIKKDRTHTIEVEHCRADGSLFMAEMRITFLRDETSKITGLLGVTRDISERKLAEMQINKLNDCFLTFGSSPQENINQLVKVCGELFNSTYAIYNRIQDGMLSIFGSWNIPEHTKFTVHPDGYISSKIIQEKSDRIQIFRDLKNSIFATTDANILQSGIETYIGKLVKFGNDNTGALCVLFKKDYSPSKNEIHLMEIIASAIGVEEERMLVQKVLEVSEEKYRTMIEHSNDWIWMLDKDACFTFINKTAENATELTAEDWIGKPFIPLVLKEDLPMLTDIFQRSMNREVCSYELRFRKNDSSILTILVNTSPIYVQGQIIGMISFGQDITERKRAEKALIDSEILYRNLVQRIPDGVYKSTAEGKFVDVNPAMVKMLGYRSKEEILKIDIKKELYFDESHRETVMLNTINEEIAIFQLRKKDGANIWVEDHGWYNFDENGHKISNEGVLRDITERKKAEEALTEKMDELMRFHRLMVGRELTMVELKKEVNSLLRKTGEVDKYKIVE